MEVFHSKEGECTQYYKIIYYINFTQEKLQKGDRWHNLRSVVMDTVKWKRLILVEFNIN